MQFPSSQLIPEGGDIYAHVFENKRQGIERNLFWSVTVNFKPLRYGDEDHRCSVTCDWIPWALKNWLELDGQCVDVAYEEDGIETSFYMAEHLFCTRTKLKLSHVEAANFRVSLETVVEFPAYYGGDGNPALPVSANAVVPFSRLIIVPENLDPVPANLAEAMNIASEFVDLSAYMEPNEKGHAIGLAPRI